MDIYQTAEELRLFLISHDLPKTDIALIGIRCPYCGKSDRIRQIDLPPVIANDLPEGDSTHYATLFNRLTTENGTLGVCKFCQSPVHLADGLRPEPFEE